MRPGILILIGALMVSAPAAWGASFGGDHILAGSNGVIREYTKTGIPLQALIVPDPTDAGESVRDFYLDADGVLYVYNGTFSPMMSMREPDGSWTHKSYDGWSTVNNISYGGIDVVGDYVFTTDMQTYSEGGEPNGIVRFDIQSSTTERFAPGTEYIDLTIGGDGRLYALYPGGSPSGTDIDVFDPNTRSLIRSIELPFALSIRGIAVDESGEIYAVGWSGMLHHFDADGVEVKNASTESLVEFENLIDIALSSSGDIVVGTRFGKVIVTDVSFDMEQAGVFDVLEGGTTFVSFSPVDLVPVAETTWGRLKNLYPE